ncbi:MAG: permease-like cell division protein FtsX [Gammaproteobacteria bacterium]
MKKPSYKGPRKKASLPRVARGGLTDKLHAYIDIHAHALFSSLGRLVRTPFTSMMTVIVLSIAISLAAGFYLLVANIQQLTDSLEDGNQISVFLKDSVSDDSGIQLADKIKRYPNVQQVRVITKAQALAEFREYSGFGEALDALAKNPLPTVIQVLPDASLTDTEQLDELLKSLDGLNEVDFAQLDMQWVKRLQSIMELARRGVTLLSIILGMAVLFITGNTIRLELHNRREEVIIAKLVGATNGFIQRPFLYTGLWLGFGSGVAAWLIVVIMVFILQQPIERLSNLYDGVFDVLYLGFTETLMLFVISASLGVIGSWIVLKYQLQQLKPE